MTMEGGGSVVIVGEGDDDCAYDYDGLLASFSSTPSVLWVITSEATRRMLRWWTTSVQYNPSGPESSSGIMNSTLMMMIIVIIIAITISTQKSSLTALSP